jgi:hypothetical protein
MSTHESDAALSRRVAEAAGYTSMTVINGNLIGHAPGKAHTGRRAVPKFATSLDAIAALEREAGLRVDVYAMANPDDGYHAWANDGSQTYFGSDSTEPRARCLAYLATKEHTT